MAYPTPEDFAQEGKERTHQLLALTEMLSRALTEFATGINLSFTIDDRAKQELLAVLDKLITSLMTLEDELLKGSDK